MKILKEPRDNSHLLKNGRMPQKHSQSNQSKIRTFAQTLQNY